MLHSLRITLGQTANLSNQPTIQAIKEFIGLVTVGFSFAIGRQVNKFMNDCLFVFFEHPYDVGDRLELYSLRENISISVIVSRQSLLYTVFRRIDNGTDMQMANQAISPKRIENVTRSGVCTEQRSIFVEFKTSFKDIMFLRAELEAFLSSKENARDYHPDLSLSLVNIYELNKIELRCIFTHKSNWSNEQLRLARSSKFLCALIAAVRKIPINKPGGPGKIGDPMRPLHSATIEAKIEAQPAQETLEMEKEEKAKVEGAARINLTMIPVVEHRPVEGASTTGVDVDAFLGNVSTGLRTRSGGSGPAGMLYP